MDGSQTVNTIFGRDRTVIGRHIKSVFSEGDLDPPLVCAKIAYTGESPSSPRTSHSMASVVIKTNYMMLKTEYLEFFL